MKYEIMLRGGSGFRQDAEYFEEEGVFLVFKDGEDHQVLAVPLDSVFIVRAI